MERGLVFLIGDVGGSLKAFTLAGAMRSAVPASATTTESPYPGAAPAVAANGTADGGLTRVTFAP